MKNVKFIQRTLLGFMLLGCIATQGQSVHFSQIDVNPTLFDPGYAGFFDGKGRFGVNYRNQWASVSEPYQTFAMTGELSLSRSRRNRNGVNLGLYAYTDQAGALNYGTSAADLILSFYQALSSRGDNLLSVACAIGGGQAGFDKENASTTDPEDFKENRVNFFNVSVGVAYFQQFNDNVLLKIGFSGQHLNRPNISYLNLDNTRLERKWNGYTRVELRAGNTFALLPMVAMQMQKKYTELIYGIDFKWYIDESYARYINFTTGLMVRHGDAIILNLFMEYNAFVFALTYDANISKLASASRTLGALEIGLVYKIAKRDKRTKTISCPVF